MNLGIVLSDPVRGLLHYPARLAVALAQDGHSVTALTWSRSGQRPSICDQLLSAGVNLVEESALRRSGWKGLLVRRLRRSTLHGQRFDALIGFGPVSLAQLKLLGVRADVVVCLVEGMGSVRTRKLWARAGALLANLVCDRVCALCTLEYERLRGLGVSRKKLSIVHNPVDCDELLLVSQALSRTQREEILRSHGLDPSKRLIACFANFNAGKRHDVLVKAIKTIEKNLDKTTVVLCGSGTEEAKIKQMVQAAGLSSHFAFLGRLQTDEAVALMAASDLLVSCSEGETFGYSMVEPLVLGRRSIVTPVGIGWDLARLNLATSTAVGDHAALADAILREMTTEDLPQRVARAREFVVTRCSTAIVADELVRLARAST